MAADDSREGWIRINVHDLRQLFQSLDPSPFYDRELDDEADAYIVASARELPQQQPRGLIIYAALNTLSDGEGDSVAEAVRRHFQRRAVAARRELTQHFRRARASLVIALPILVLTLIGSEIATRAIDADRLRFLVGESLLIGGWVAMWRPIELFLYDWWPIRDTQRVLERLGRIDVQVRPASTRDLL